MLFITTSNNCDDKQVLEAKNTATLMGAPYIERANKAIKTLFNDTQLNEVIIVTKKELRYQNIRGDVFFFHPSASVLRIHQLRRGQADLLVTFAEMLSGDEVLDCTLGFGSDSIVSSFVVGSKGKVVALESQPIISTLVSHGLKRYQSGYEDTDQAMRKIRVINEKYEIYLSQLADRSFDIILFDPMFAQTVVTSTAIQSLKLLANHQPISAKAIEEAKRVARKKVVLKERSLSSEFQRLGFTVVKKTARYALGVIDVRDKDESPET